MTPIRILGRFTAAIAVVAVSGATLYGGALLAAEGDALRALDRRADGSAILNLVVTDGPMEPPAIAFTDEAGEQLSLADYRGTPVAVHFWATWCFPCRAELPTMDALQREFGDTLVILPLSLDRDGAALVRNYYEDHDLTTLPVMIDEKMAAGRALRVHGIPATIFVNGEGAEVARVLGDRDWTDPAVIELVRHIIQ
jgi:thiol-disulfide isomerase/thioredoxin